MYMDLPACCSPLPWSRQLDSGNLSGDRLYLIGFSDEDGMKVWSDKMEEMIAMVRGQCTCGASINL